jgi:hypothetical protein
MATKQPTTIPSVTESQSLVLRSTAKAVEIRAAQVEVRQCKANLKAAIALEDAKWGELLGIAEALDEEHPLLPEEEADVEVGP